MGRPTVTTTYFNITVAQERERERMQTLDDMIAVMQAARDGRQIQCRQRKVSHCSPQEWIGYEPPYWNWVDFEYRVKPEPREWFLLLNAKGNVLDGHADREMIEGRSHGPGRQVVRVCEVIED